MSYCLLKCIGSTVWNNKFFIKSLFSKNFTTWWWLHCPQIGCLILCLVNKRISGQLIAKVEFRLCLNNVILLNENKLRSICQSKRKGLWLMEQTHKYWWGSNLPQIVNLYVLTVSSIWPVTHLHKFKTLVLSNTWFSNSGFNTFRSPCLTLGR